MTTASATSKARICWPIRRAALPDLCDWCGRRASSALCDRCAQVYEARLLETFRAAS